jgi:hypothetical protein
VKLSDCTSNPDFPFIYVYLNIGSSFVNGVCASCSSCDPYVEDAPIDADSARQYMFWQAEGAVRYLFLLRDKLLHMNSCFN